MPRGSKTSYSSKQKRQAEHIADSYRERGDSPETAKARAWKTVNKQSGGGARKKKKSGASQRRSRKTASGR